MPFYEYECSNCKFYTEVMQKITDAPLTKCPSCGKKALIKLVSAPNFRLKGGGWYETDFKGDKENKRNLAGGDADGAPAASDSKADASSSTEASKSEPAKADAGKAEAPAKAPSVPGSRKPKVAGKSTGAGGRSSKPAARSAPARAAAAKARPAASRKAKPAPARKKGRR